MVEDTAEIIERKLVRVTYDRQTQWSWSSIGTFLSSKVRVFLYMD